MAEKLNSTFEMGKVSVHCYSKSFFLSSNLLQVRPGGSMVLSDGSVVSTKGKSSDFS